MATTFPNKYEGKPQLTAGAVLSFIDWYEGALGDMDKASEIEGACYYEGWANAMECVLDMLFNREEKSDECA